METTLQHTVHIAVVLVVPPLLLGVINKTKALFAGRVGPPLLQAYWDLLKLVQKGTVFSTTTTWVFRAGPVVGLVTALLALLLIPLGGEQAPLSFPGDLLLVVYLFALGRFFTTAAALDTGSPFEGMGAAREVTYSCLAEPALLLGFLVLAQLSDSLELSRMLGASVAGHWASERGASLALVLVSWFIVLLVENCRVPFDDPNTHLELTMIHEVMVLDHSGPAFAMILYGASLKLMAFGALIVHLAVPVRSGLPWLDWPVFLGGTLGVAALVGVVESTMARLRLPHIPVLLVAACLLAAFGIILVLR
jgi:formate hydrogenlyase subunit 4